ncbi:unnamed protein product, partial [Ectocarpus fasciculatus]
ACPVGLAPWPRPVFWPSCFLEPGSCPAESLSLTPFFGPGADPAASASGSAAAAADAAKASPTFSPRELQPRWLQLPRIAPVMPPPSLPLRPPSPLLLLLPPLLADGIPETAGSRRSMQ